MRTASTQGYLLKLSVGQGDGAAAWKRRYYRLRGCLFSLYADHLAAAAEEPKAELLLFSETVVRDVSPTSSSSSSSGNDHTQPHVLALSGPFTELRLACASALEMAQWLKAFKRAIATARTHSLRGHLFKVDHDEAPTPARRKFFVLHADAVSAHRDPSTLDTVIGLVHFNRHTLVEYHDRSRRLVVTDTSTRQRLTMSFESVASSPRALANHHREDDGGDGADYVRWKEQLLANVCAHAGATVQDADAVVDLHAGVADAVMSGALKVALPEPAPAPGPGPGPGHHLGRSGPVTLWVEHPVFLTDRAMLVVDGAANDRRCVRCARPSLDLSLPSPVSHFVPSL